MFKIFSELYESKELACFYNDYENTKTFYFGFVIAFNKKEIAIQLISVDGTDDGIIVTNINNIFKVETGGQYIEKVKKLVSFSEIPEFHDIFNENEIYKSILEFADNTNEIVSIELINSGVNDVIGFVESVSEDICRVKQIDEYGFDDGISCIKIEDITEISYSRVEEKRLLRLWKFNA